MQNFNQINNTNNIKLSINQKKLLCLMKVRQLDCKKYNLKMSVLQLVKFIMICNSDDNLLGIFDLNKCCLYSSSCNNKYGNNFYMNNKKIAIHRLIYINFINDLDENVYLKHKCMNKNCCNINHIEKANLNINEAKYEIYKIPSNNNNDKIIINLND